MVSVLSVLTRSSLRLYENSRKLVASPRRGCGWRETHWLGHRRATSAPAIMAPERSVTVPRREATAVGAHTKRPEVTPTG
jgi:hypothetical protein